jgi:hypothetical protein
LTYATSPVRRYLSTQANHHFCTSHNYAEHGRAKSKSNRIDITKCDLEENRRPLHIPITKYAGNLEGLKRLFRVRQYYKDSSSNRLTSFEIVKVVDNIVLLIEIMEIFVNPRDNNRLF